MPSISCCFVNRATADDEVEKDVVCVARYFFNVDQGDRRRSFVIRGHW